MGGQFSLFSKNLLHFTFTKTFLGHFTLFSKTHQDPLTCRLDISLVPFIYVHVSMVLLLFILYDNFGH
jgi:hypothetical protein